MKNDAPDPREKIAIIDIGSNSVRLFLFQIVGQAIEQVSAMKSFCGLGKDLGTTGNLNPEAVELTRQSLRSFREEIDKYHIKSEIVIGTAALREATDTARFLEDVKADSGFDIKVISGDEEARLAALAILSIDPVATGVVADFGGGSLELARIGNGKIAQKISLKLGAHYLKARKDRSGFIDQEFRALLSSSVEFTTVDNLYIIGGSWRSLIKAWLQDQGLNEVVLEGFTFEGSQIIPFCRSLQAMEPQELIVRYDMEPARAKLMDVSALMLEKIIINLSPEKVKVSMAGIRDGLAYDYMQTRAN